MATLTQMWTQIHGEVKKVAVSFDKNLHRAEVNFENACYSIRQSPLILLCPPASVDGGMPPVKVFPEARHHAVAEDVLDEAPHRQRLGPAKHQPQVRLPPRQVRRVVPSVRTIDLFLRIKIICRTDMQIIGTLQIFCRYSFYLPMWFISAHEFKKCDTYFSQDNLAIQNGEDKIHSICRYNALSAAMYKICR